MSLSVTIRETNSIETMDGRQALPAKRNAAWGLLGAGLLGAGPTPKV